MVGGELQGLVGRLVQCRENLDKGCNVTKEWIWLGSQSNRGGSHGKCGLPNDPEREMNGD